MAADIITSEIIRTQTAAGGDETVYGEPMLSDLCGAGLDPLFWKNARAGVPSAWHGHVPFAYWLVHALRPRIVVELGTHNGVSYSAFCEGVIHSRIDARCYAVDTWVGDEHAGTYPEDVYKDFKAFHDTRYAGFSGLLRTTFDEALSYFKEGSVDLLHIDGFHSYEAVSHDFNRWLSKLSERGVVLLHDTNVRERGFGVWRFWEEISGTYRSFEFLHGYGLGVLLVGSNVPPVVASLCGLRDMATVNLIRDRFATLGQRHILEFELLGGQERAESDRAQIEIEIDCKSELQRRAAENESYAAAARQEHENRAGHLAQESEARIAQLRQDHEEHVNELTRVQENQLASLHQQHEARVADLVGKYDAEIALLAQALADANARAAQSDDLVRSLRVESARQYREYRKVAKDLAKEKNERVLVEAENLEAGSRLAELTAALSQQRAHLDALLDSTSWRLTGPLRRALTLLRERDQRVQRMASISGVGRRRDYPAIMPPAVTRIDDSSGFAERLGTDSVAITYEQWIRRFDELSVRDRQAIRLHLASGTLPSVLVIVYFDGASLSHALATIKDLQGQLLECWSAVLCFGEDCSPDGLDHLSDQIHADPRFTVMRKSPGDDGLRELVRVSTRDCILVCSGGVKLREHSLYVFAAAAEANPKARLIYSDHDSLDGNGRRSRPYFKPRFSPELLSSTEYLGPCILLRRGDADILTFVEKVLAGDVSDFARLVARVHSTSDVVRVPFVLYHLVTGFSSIFVSVAREAFSEQRLAERDLPSVSIVIPTRDGLHLLEPCLTSIQELTAYPRSKIEVIVVDNGSTDAETLSFLSNQTAAGRIRVLRDRQKFNYSRINNAGASVAAGDVLIFLNNDTKVKDPGWLQCLVEYAVQEDVGAVGAKLLYPDDTVQHGGVVVGIQGVAAHAHVGLSEREGGYENLANVNHEVSAVTGACLAIRRTVFETIGGFNPELAVAFNDVLLCLDVAAAGLRTVYIGSPLMYHFESKTRGFDNTPEKIALFRSEALLVRRKHLQVFRDDPYYNPNLSLERAYDLAFPPRRIKPWRRFAGGSSGEARVLMLSCTHEVGHGVAVVLSLQASYLSKRGFQVYVGGPSGDNEFAYEGCHRVYLDSPMEAATFAVEHDIDCIVAHTPPFFSVVRWTGESPKTILYDYGEPHPDLFPDAAERSEILAEKRFCYNGADRVYAISNSVRAEAGDDRVDVIPLGNSHLTSWDGRVALRRDAVREKLGWTDQVIVLNVCRFHQAERRYKGIDLYASIADEFFASEPLLRSKVVFALCGRGTDDDVREMEGAGLRVFANITDSEMVDLYAASDVYMNFSKWEGYNLGIGQALAFGLPVVASDIPAHREFPIFVSDDPAAIIGELTRVIEGISSDTTAARMPVVFSWQGPLSRFETAISELCASDTSRES